MQHEGTANPEKPRERRSLLLQLSDTLRELGSPEEILAAVSETLGRTLCAGQVGYAEVDDSGDCVRIEREWNDGSMPSNVGDHRLDEFGPAFIADLKRGETIIIADVRADQRTSSPEALATFGKASIRGFLNVPLVKQGRLSAVLAVHSPEPKTWTDEDVWLAEDVAERTWSALFRVRAELAVRQSEAKYRKLHAAAERKAAELEAVLESMPDGVYIGSIDGITLANQVALDQLGFASREELQRNIAILSKEVETRDAQSGRFIPPDEQAFTPHDLHGDWPRSFKIRGSMNDQGVTACGAAIMMGVGFAVARTAIL